MLTGSLIILLVHVPSVCMPHGGYAEEGYITELELVKIIMEEVTELGAKDFLICGDLNTELMLETDDAGLELQGA